MSAAIRCTSATRPLLVSPLAQTQHGLMRMALALMVFGGCSMYFDEPVKGDAGMESDAPTVQTCEAPSAPYPMPTYGTGTVTLTAAEWQEVVMFRDRALNYFECTTR